MQKYDIPDNKAIHWKKSETVPGRPVSSTIQNVHLVQDINPGTSPRKLLSKTKHRKTSSTSSFQEFQESTDDAWSNKDDEFCSTSVSIHPKVAQSTALKVLSNHRKGTLNSNSCVLNSASTKSVPEALTTNIQKISSNSNAKTEESREKIPVTENDKSSQHGSPMHNPTAIYGPGIGIRLMYKKPSMFHVGPNLSYATSTATSSEREKARLEMFSSLLQCENTDINELKKLSWSGVPYSLRPLTWKLLSGYLPTCLERRECFLLRKKEEYLTLVSRYYNTRDEESYHETYRQIHIDVPRMSPLVPLFQQEIVQMAFERILYILAIRHPASGYVQGMNDLVTPFFVVFLQDFIPSDADVECYDVSCLSLDALQQVEANSYWCMDKLLDSIQDNYTFAQPGIQKKVNRLKELISRVDAPLHNHLLKHSIEYLQFSFRWMNNLLMRELPLSCTIRLWDTYLSEVNGFSNFHLYVCAAFLKYWSKELLLEKEFQGLMLALQNFPTLHWTDNEISLLVAEAYRLKYAFDDAPNHLQKSEG